MEKFVTKHGTTPPSLVVFRRQVLVQSARQGDLLLSRYPLTHELFKENLGADYAVVQYKGYGPEGNTTEPLANLGNSMDKVNEFEQKQAQAEALRKADLGLRQ